MIKGAVVMRWLQNLKISTQLFLLGIIVTVMLCIISGVGFYIIHMNDDLHDALIYSSKTNSYVRQMVHEWKNVLLRMGNQKDLDRYSTQMNDAAKLAIENIKALEKTAEMLNINPKPVFRLEKEIEVLHDKYRIEVNGLQGETHEKHHELLHQLDAKLRGLDRSVSEASFSLATYFNQQVDQVSQFYYVLFVVVVAVTMLLTFILIILLGRMLSSNIKALIMATQAVAEGDLRKKIPVQSRNEFGQLAKSFNQMTENLSVLALSSQESSLHLFDMLSQLQEAVTAQIAGSNEQASSVNETTSAIQQIKTSSSMTLEKAKTLGESAEHTRKEGEKGLESVQYSIDGMNKIKEKVKAIAQSILGLSDHTQMIGETTEAVSGLAQQSKLLALNASIEAAKAGEAGKGFAVVAQEVKDLAEQSQDATNKVQKILQDIQQATDRAVMATEEGSKVVEEGLEMVGKAGEAIQQLSTVIKETASSTQQIMVAIRQEAGGIDQIAEAMDEINKATEQFTVTAKQTDEAAHQLQEIANTIQKSVDVYKVEKQNEE